MIAIKQWERKRADVIILLLYLFVFSLGMHVFSSLRTRAYEDVSIADKLLNPFHYLVSLVITLIFLSPFSFYFKKVPRKLIIDAETGKLQIQKRRNAKPLNFDLSRITYCASHTRFFCILEIYSEVTTSRGITMKKRFTSIVVPAFGFSWNKQVIREISTNLDQLGVPLEENPQQRTIWEHIYN